MNWNSIYRRLWIVVLVPLVAGSIAFALTYKKAGQYKSTAIVEASIPDQPTKTQTLKDIQDPNQYYENLVGMMQTELVTSMVSYRLLLHDLEKDIAFRPPAIQYDNGRRELIKSTLEKKLASFQTLQENNPTEETINKVIHNMDYNIARWIRDGEMSISRKPNTSEIAVATTTEDPFLSAFASNALSQEYIRYETSVLTPEPTNSTPNNDSIGYYRQEVDRLRQEVEQKNEEITEASNKSKAPVDDMVFRRAKSNRIAEYEMKIVEEEWELNSLRDELSKLQRSQPEEQPRTSNAEVATNAKIQAARKKIDQLSSIYEEGGKKDRRLDSMITVLTKQVNAEAARIQTASQSSSKESPLAKEKDMLNSRIQKHEQSIASIRNDIRRLKNTSSSASKSNVNEVAQLKTAQEKATKEYNVVLARLKKLEKESGIVTTNVARASHHLILKAKALPSAEPESPWAMFIVIGSFVVTLIVCLLVLGVKKQAPTIPDDIFLRVNYANRQRRRTNTQQPITNNQ